VLLNVLEACRATKISADVFTVAEMPVSDWGTELAASLQRTKKLLVVEEHVARGGLGEHLAAYILSCGLSPRWEHRAALGYPGNRYGSQAYHQQQSGLDAASLAAVMRRMIHG
jgi:transketolase